MDNVEEEPTVVSREAQHQARKDRAKQMRREAYLKAKERQKSDPRWLAKKAADKEKRKAAYQDAKARQKERLAERSKARSRSSYEQSQEASDDGRPLAPVISLDQHRRRKSAARSP